MNETECDDLIKSVKWTEPSNLISLAILEFINVLVIGGNLLVIAAVFCSTKLRSVTNFFIVNLAVADLLVGLAVLPFSATWEVFKVWIFGDVWCRIWLAVDVWMCTASILNLCAISLDRYVAVTRPVTYPSIMSTKKAKSLIAGIWVLSFVICFPPLVGWKDQKPVIEQQQQKQPATYTKGNYTLYYATTSTSKPIPSTILPSLVTEPSTAAVTATSSSMPLTAETGYATVASSLSLKHKRRRQKRFKTTIIAATTNSNSNSNSNSINSSSRSSRIKNNPSLVTQQTSRSKRKKRQTKKINSSSSSTSSLLYNSFKPHDPYFKHLKNYNVDATAIVNNPVVNDNYADTDVDDADTDAINSFYNDSDDILLEDDDDDDDYELASNDSSEYDGSSSNSGFAYNNQNKPTPYPYYDTTDSRTSTITTTAAATATGAASATTNTYGSSLSSSLSSYTSPPPCPWKCELTNDRGYVLYSALGSFYIPMFVMLFFYWRIYRAAVRTTRAINQGFKTTKGSSHESRTNRVDENQLVLRIHRGRPCSTPQRTPLSVHSMSSTLSVNSNQEEMYHQNQHHLQHTLHHHHHQANVPQQQLNVPPKRATSMKVPRTKHEKISIKVSFPSSENMLDSTTSISSTPLAYASVASSSNMLAGSHAIVTATSTSAATTPVKAASTASLTTNGRRSSFKSSLFEIGETTFNVDTHSHDIDNTPTHSSRLIENHTDSLLKKSDRKQRGKRSVKFQVKRFKVETKAAKTLAIIVGGFIFCWLPFFTMYLIRAFCDHCIQPTVFSVLFWLGYCNSAINPLIYALFSHEFRIAFKRIVCRCVCTRSGFRASENFQMIAARAFMAPATFHKTISGCSDEGDGPEFS